MNNGMNYEKNESYYHNYAHMYYIGYNLNVIIIYNLK